MPDVSAVEAVVTIRVCQHTQSVRNEVDITSSGRLLVYAHTLSPGLILEL